MPPLFDVRQALQDEPHYNALSHDSPVQPPRRSAIAASGIDKTMTATQAGTSLPPASEWQRHGEKVDHEPENEKVSGPGRSVADWALGLIESVYTPWGWSRLSDAASYARRVLAKRPSLKARGRDAQWGLVTRIVQEVRTPLGTA